MGMQLNGKNGKKGQMLVLAAASVAALIALAGVGVDMSNLIIKHYQLQRALDAAVLNDILYNELNINRQMRKSDGAAKAIDFIKTATVANLKMMGIDVAANDLIIDGTDAAHKTGIHIFINGMDVLVNQAPPASQDDECGCSCSSDPTVPVDPILSNVSSIRVCVTAQLNVKTTLMKIVGIKTVPLLVTSCSRRVMAAITMVLDISYSMRGTPFNDLCNASKDFIDQFQESIDMMSIVTFNTHARIWQPLKRINDISYGGMTGKDALKAIVDSIHDAGVAGDTNLPEALLTARKELEKAPGPNNGEPGAFKTIVIFSDGAPTAMTVDFAHPSTTVPDHLKPPLLTSELPLNNWDPYATSSIDLPARNPQWQPLPTNTYAINPTFTLGGPSSHVYTYIGNYYWSGFNLLKPSDAVPANTSQYKDINPPCSSDLSVNWLWGSSRIYNDVMDCLDDLNFYDSKGIYQKVDPILNDSIQNHINRPSPYYPMGGSSGNTMMNLKMPYLASIIEADYAMQDGVTLYAVGLSQDHSICGPTSNPYSPCCGPDSHTGVGGAPLACDPPPVSNPCVANDPRVECQPCPTCVTQPKTS